MKKATLLLTLTFILVFGLSSVVHAAGVVGTGTLASCDEAALDAALAGGGAVTFNCGGAAHTIAISGQKTIGADTSIDGGGLITIDGGASTFRLFEVSAGFTLTLNNISLTRGSTAGGNDGGAVLVNSSATLEADNVTFNANYSNDNGGAIYNNGGTLDIDNSTFMSNSSNDLGGGIYNVSGTADIDNTTFNGNQTPDDGGAIYIAFGTVNLTDSVLQNHNNATLNDGGAIYINNGALNIYGSAFSNNAAPNDNGGAIYQNGGIVTINNSAATNSSFSNNTSNQDGGAIYINSGSLTITGTAGNLISFSGNQATSNLGDGGAIGLSNPGLLTVSYASFSNNTATNGGAIYHNAATLLTITNSVFSSNQANVTINGSGGAVALDNTNAGSSAMISGSTFDNNSSNDSGGAIYNDAEPFTVTTSTFSNNTANDANNNGVQAGAIFNTGTADGTTITLSAFTGNTAQTTDNSDSYGGAIYNQGTNFVLANSTFSGNSATQDNPGLGDARGGALWTNANVAVYNSTFSGNFTSETGTESADGGNIYRAGGTLTLYNTIVANGLTNGSADNCGGTITDGGNNVDYNGGDDCGAGFDHTDPLLGALTGSPAYFPLTATTSSAMDAGSNAVCAAVPVGNLSQNGVTRPKDGDLDLTAVCDIGSYEDPGDVTPPSLTSFTRHGAATEPNNEDIQYFLATFSEPVQNVTADDFTVNSTSTATGITVLGLTTSTYRLAVSGGDLASFDGSVGVDLAGGQNIADLAGNPLPAGEPATDETWTVDNTAPTVTVNQGPAQADPTNGTVHFRIVFSEPVTGFTITDVTPGGTSNPTGWSLTGSGTTYDVIVGFMSNDGTVTLSIGSSVAVDAAGNPNVASTSSDNTVTYDGTGPTVTIDQAGGQPDPTAGSPINFTVVFNESVSDFATGDVTIGGTANPSTAVVSGSGTTYNVAVSGMTGSGTVTASIGSGVATDPLGNGNTASTSTDATVTYDITAPSLLSFARLTPANSLTNVNTLVFQATFDTAVANVSIGDFTPTGTTATVTGVSPVNSTTYDLTVSGGDLATLNGVVGIDLSGGQDITDIPGNALPAGEPATDQTYTLDNIPPGVTINQHATQDDPTTAGTIYFTLVFSETVTGFSTADITYSGTLSYASYGFSLVSPNTYELFISNFGGSEGTVSATMDANRVFDLAGNGNTASTSTDNTVTRDTTTPALVSFSRETPATTPTNADTLVFRVSFNEDMANVSAADFDVTGTTATVTNVSSLNAATYLITASSGDLANLNGTVGLDLAGGQDITDLAGNALPAGEPATDETYTLDNSVPTVIVEQAGGQSDPTSTSPINFSVTFSEAVIGFADGDVTLGGTAPGPLSAAVTGSGTTYNVAVSGMTGDGTVTAALLAGVAADAAGNTSAASTSTDNSVIYDNTAPAVTIDQAGGQADPTNTSPINFTVVFSEAVTGFATGDVTLSGTAGATTGTVTEIGPNDGTTYNVAVSGMTSDGTVVATVVGGVATDGVGTPSTASTSTDNSVLYDTTAPTVTVEQAGGQSDPTSASPINFTATFNESVTGLVDGDITLGGTAPGTLSAAVTGSGTSYNVAVSGMTGSGTVTAALLAGVAADAAGNTSAASTSTDNEVTYDITLPVVGSSDILPLYNSAPPTFFSFIFSKDLNDPAGSTDPDDITNPDNFLLVEAGPDGVMDTLSCAAGVQNDDLAIPINTVVYDNGSFTATVNFNSGVTLLNGSYRIFACGSTSILDTVGNALAGDGSVEGTDNITDFVVAIPDEMPETGFAPGVHTILPAQPKEKAYAESGLVLEIPALGIESSIMGVPVVDGEWDTAWLGSSAGYLAGTAFPTTPGNTVLTGHVYDNNNHPGPFFALRSLRYGDQIKIHAWGQTYTYEVRESRLLWPSLVSRALQHEELDWVTLITCEFYNPDSGGYNLRRVVRAVLIRVE